MTSNDSEIRALLDAWIDACRKKDIDRLMALYDPDIVYYDVVPPLRFAGHDEVRGNFLRWFAEYDGPIGLEPQEPNISVSGDVAFAHTLIEDSGKRKEGVPDGEVWVRATVCCRRSGDRWWIVHEHISLPIGWQKEDA